MVRATVRTWQRFCNLYRCSPFLFYEPDIINLIPMLSVVCRFYCPLKIGIEPSNFVILCLTGRCINLNYSDVSLLAIQGNRYDPYSINRVIAQKSVTLFHCLGKPQLHTGLLFDFLNQLIVAPSTCFQWPCHFHLSSAIPQDTKCLCLPIVAFVNKRCHF